MSRLQSEAMRQARAYAAPRARLILRQAVLLGLAGAALGLAGLFITLAVTVALAQELGLVVALLLMALFFGILGALAYLLSRRPPRRIIVPQPGRVPPDLLPRGVAGTLVSVVLGEMLAPHRRRGMIAPTLAALGAAYVTARLQSRRRKR